MMPRRRRAETYSIIRLRGARASRARPTNRAGAKIAGGRNAHHRPRYGVALRLFKLRTKAPIACATLLRRSQNWSRSVLRLIEASRQFGQTETNDVQLNPNLTCAISKGSRQ
jgi:hypothetical protein